MNMSANFIFYFITWSKIVKKKEVIFVRITSFFGDIKDDPTFYMEIKLCETLICHVIIRFLAYAHLSILEKE